MWVFSITAWALDWTDDQAFKKTFNLSWQHYNPLGYAHLNLRTDQQLGFIQQLGLGHYFDAWDIGLRIDGNRISQGDGFKMGYLLSKKLFDKYHLAFRYQPLDHSREYMFHGKITDSLWLRLSYNSYGGNWDVGGRWRPAGLCSLSMSANDRQDDWAIMTGLQVTFYSGKRREVKYRKEKPIVWE